MWLYGISDHGAGGLSSQWGSTIKSPIVCTAAIQCPSWDNYRCYQDMQYVLYTTLLLIMCYLSYILFQDKRNIGNTKAIYVNYLVSSCTVCQYSSDPCVLTQFPITSFYFGRHTSLHTMSVRPHSETHTHID